MPLILVYSLIYVFHLVKESLDESNLDNIKMFALQLEANISCSATYKFRQAYSNRIELDTLYRMHRRIAIFSGIKPEVYHCCVNTCCAFTNQSSSHSICPFCGKLQYSTDRKPQVIFEYLPIIPHLQGFFESTMMINSLSYHANREHAVGEYSDIFDGAHY